MDLSEQSYLEAVDVESDAGGARGRAVSLRAALVSNYERLLRRLARHLGCPDLAAESLHDTWLRLGVAGVHVAVQSPQAYVYRVACNLAMDRLRANRPWQGTGDADDELAHLADPSPGPERIAETRSELAAVERAMQKLPLRHRSILVALRIEEMTRDEVALRHGLSLRRVDTALKQALAGLQGG